MNNIQVSVIIPTYNRADLLIQTLESLLHQKYAKELFEVIVVDNNSKDNTYVSVEKFIEEHHNDLNLKYTLENRQGDIYARHTGAYHSEGDILIFTDDDATFDVNWISEITHVFDLYSAVGAVGTRILIKWDKEPPRWVVNYESLLGKITFGEAYTVQETGMFINNGSLAIKKHIYKEIKGNNPGQIENYLIGDAEVGLCRKLHEKHISIAFSDKTTMWHHQFVNTNGTFKDILRRVANNGIAEAYTYYIIEQKKSRCFLLKSIFLAFMGIIKSIFSFKQKKIINSILKFHQLRYRFLFIKRFQTDIKLMSLMSNKDWLFDENYIGSKLIFNNKIYAGTN